MKFFKLSSIIVGLCAIFCLNKTLVGQTKEQKNYIRVDQFGYLPNAPKYAVIAKAMKGFNAGLGIDLDATKKVELRSAKDQSVVFSANAPSWTGGETDAYSGDKGWWFNFTSYTTQGDYFVRVYKTDGGYIDSYGFSIKNDIYSEPLRAAMNMFYYQRINQNKTAEYASGEKWVDGPWYEGAAQEKSSSYLLDNSKKKDTSKGWFDAGDPNKYITFGADVMHDLLQTYESHPNMWKTFNLKIPESNNNIPDILDEIKWEADYYRNMVDPATGGFHIKSGILNDPAYISPPSTDNRTRYYDKVCPSASIVGAGVLAHTALVFKGVKDLEVYANECIVIAEKAFTFYENAPDKAARCDNGEIEAGDADGSGDHYAIEHLAEANCAAIYLYALTGKAKYNDFIKANYQTTRPYKAGDWGVYRPNQSLSLLYYTTLPNADGPTKDAILQRKTSPSYSSGQHYEVQESKNLYRAVSYYQLWGSNSLMARLGNDNMDFINYNLLPADHPRFREKALGMVNYFHGVNPFGYCYLSNMYMYGAEYCYDEMWHSWFKPDTKYDNIDNGKVGPAPGYLSGGFNKANAGQAKMKIGTDFFEAFVADQPDQKAYSNDNTGGPANPWVFNEPGLYYNSGYVKLLANFVAGNSAPVAATELTVTPLKDTLSLGKTLAIKASIKPANATNQIVAWSVSDATIATISNNGVLTGLKEGKVTVTAKAEEGKLIANAEITVVFIAVKSLLVKPENATIFVNGSVTIVPSITPLNASNSGFVYTSANEQVATVTNTGAVIGKAVGKVEITCATADGSVKAKATITVEAVPVLEKCGVLENGGFEAGLLGWTNNNNSTILGEITKTGKYAAVIEKEGGISFPTKFKVNAKSTVTLKYWAKVEGTNAFPQMGVDFFDASGKELTEISLVVPEGTKDFTEFSKSIVVPDNVVEMALWSYKGGNTGKLFLDDVCLTITEPVAVASVSLAKAAETVKVGETVDLVTTVLPTNAQNKKVSYSSSDNNIAKVDANGRVSGIAVGTANIVVTTEDGAKNAKTEVTVLKADPVAVCGVVENGDFEVDLSRWENTNNATKITSDVKSGKKAIVIEGDGGVITRANIAMREDAEFKFSAWAKLEGNANGIIGINFLNASGVSITNLEAKLNNSVYYQQTLNAKTPFGTKFIQIYAKKVGASGKVFVDDICLEIAAILAYEPMFKNSQNLFPNPAHNTVNIKILDKTQKLMLVNMYDAAGKVVLQKSIQLKHNQQSVELALGSLKNGIYYVKTQQGNKYGTYKLIKE